MPTAIRFANEFRVATGPERPKAAQARAFGHIVRTLAGWIRATVRRHAAARRRRETIRWLQIFDDRLLADIGLRRRDVAFPARHGFMCLHAGI
jgi:uncharacterized protein YjiS (DUF1127 family)